MVNLSSVLAAFVRGRSPSARKQNQIGADFIVSQKEAISKWAALWKKSRQDLGRKRPSRCIKIFALIHAIAILNSGDRFHRIQECNACQSARHTDTFSESYAEGLRQAGIACPARAGRRPPPLPGNPTWLLSPSRSCLHDRRKMVLPVQHPSPEPEFRPAPGNR